MLYIVSFQDEASLWPKSTRTAVAMGRQERKLISKIREDIDKFESLRISEQQPRNTADSLSLQFRKTEEFLRLYFKPGIVTRFTECWRPYRDTEDAEGERYVDYIDEIVSACVRNLRSLVAELKTSPAEVLLSPTWQKSALKWIAVTLLTALIGNLIKEGFQYFISKKPEKPQNNIESQPPSPNETPKVHQESHGPNSQNISVTNGTVTINNGPSPSTPKPQTEKAEVTLKLVRANVPILVLINRSKNMVAKNIRWAVVLLNRDLPDRSDPLPIPVSTFDWLRPNSESGPLGIFGDQKVSSLLRDGDRLWGSISVDCPECKSGSSYFVGITWGHGGWYAKIDDVKNGEVVIPKNFTRQGRETYFKTMETLIPESLKMPILND